MSKCRDIYRIYSIQLLLGLIGIPVGMIIGIIDTVFGKVLLKLTEIRGIYPYFLISLLPLAGIFIVYSFLKWGGSCSKGMNLVFEVGHGDEEIIPLRLVPFVILATWITHLFGGSAGREGVAVQIGATFSNWFGRHIPIKIKDAPRIFLVVGMAAGFAGLFQTPVAAVLFAMEVLVAGQLKYEALLPAVTASFVASTTSQMLGLSKFSCLLTFDFSLTGMLFIKLVLLGVIFGVAGGMFAWLLQKTKEFMTKKLSNPILKIALIGVVLSCLLLLLGKGRYSGLGTNLIENCFYNGTIYQWDWILKFIFTIMTLSAGFQGGEVTPLFAIGSSLGVLLAGLAGLPVTFVAALGYAAVFGSATNTFFAPVLIGAEVFGFNYLPYFFIVCAVSYIFNYNKSIYSLQKNIEIKKYKNSR